MPPPPVSHSLAISVSYPRFRPSPDPIARYLTLSSDCDSHPFISSIAVSQVCFQLLNHEFGHLATMNQSANS
ncbi:hypothetical protein K1719_020573 [Acacia pycnantha]|nr:hypothetical protein K1719_020573 [Acacia pycnantha]